jgi:hypothetical protein
MRRHLLLRSLVLSGAAFSLVAVGTAASVTLLSDRVGIPSVGGDSTGTPEHPGGGGTAAPAPDGLTPNLASRDPQISEPASVKSAGPSVFEQEARSKQYPQQVSVGPSTFEQQIRAQVPSPGPTPISRRPGF